MKATQQCFILPKSSRKPGERGVALTKFFELYEAVQQEEFQAAQAAEDLANTPPPFRQDRS